MPDVLMLAQDQLALLDHIADAVDHVAEGGPAALRPAAEPAVLPAVELEVALERGAMAAVGGGPLGEPVPVVFAAAGVARWLWPAGDQAPGNAEAPAAGDPGPVGPAAAQPHPSRLGGRGHAVVALGRHRAASEQ